MKYFIFVFTILLSSCGYPIFTLVYQGDYLNQDIDYQPRNFDEAWHWVYHNIKYKSDPPCGYKKQPEETYHDRCGDCEDFALLLAYFGVKLGCDVMVIRIPGSEPWKTHIICKINGKYLEPQRYHYYYKKDEITILKEWTYNEAFYDPGIRSIEQ